MVEWLFLAVPWGCLRFVIVVFPDDTHLLFAKETYIFVILQGGGVGSPPPVPPLDPHMGLLNTVYTQNQSFGSRNLL